MYLAQLNIARLLAPIDSPQIAEFVAQLDPINALAEQSTGFVWRLKDDSDNATDINPFGDDFMIVNMSVWENLDVLKDFVFRTAHANVMRDRAKWFEKHLTPYMVLWWISKEHIPTVEEAQERLAYLHQHGDSPYAFTFKVRYDADGRLV